MGKYNVKYDEKEFLKELQYLVNTDSGTGYIAGIEEIANFFKKKYERLGLCVDMKTFDPKYGPCIEVKSHTDEKEIDLLMICHMDTVFPVGTVVQRPFYIIEDQAFGPGIADSKSGSLLITAIIENLRLYRPDLKVCVAMNCDNEIGAPSSRSWIWELARNAKYCFGFEAGRQDGSFVDERKGAAFYHIKMYGKSTHAGIDPRGGASAVLEMANWICRFADYDRLPLGTSLNFGVVQGGTQYNVIPDYAESKVDVRFETEEQYRIVNEEIYDLCKNPYNPEITVTVDIISKSVPMNRNERSDELIRIMEKEAELQNSDIRFTSTGGVGDANIASSAGAGTVDGCGVVGSYLHSPKERIRISSIKERLELLVNVCMKI